MRFNDRNRNIASICFMGDYGQTMPILSTGVIEKHKFKHDE